MDMKFIDKHLGLKYLEQLPDMSGHILLLDQINNETYPIFYIRVRLIIVPIDEASFIPSCLRNKKKFDFRPKNRHASLLLQRLHFYTVVIVFNNCIIKHSCAVKGVGVSNSMFSLAG